MPLKNKIIYNYFNKVTRKAFKQLYYIVDKLSTVT